MPKLLEVGRSGQDSFYGPMQADCDLAQHKIADPVSLKANHHQICLIWVDWEITHVRAD